MLFEYAVEPQAIGSNWQTFLYLIEKFGFDRGRLISRLPDKWEKKVIQAAKEAGVPDVRMASIIERLKNAKLAIVDFGRPFDFDKPWIANALAENERKPFHAIIAQQGVAGNPAVLIAADLDELSPLMAIPQDRAVPRDPQSITDALGGFLRASKRIVFVDPFFDPYNNRYKSVIRACLAVVKAENSSATCEIHYRFHENRPSNVEIERDAAMLFRGVIPEGLTVSIYCWREKDGGADWHARYLLTEKGGVSVEAGFSAEGEHQTTDVRLMGFLLSQMRLSSFGRGATDFELVVPILEVATGGIVRRV